MIKDGIEFKECDKCGKLCAKLEMVNWKTCKECVISGLEAEVTRLRNENLGIINKYTRFAETDRRTITELEAQIEKMKCCANCKHSRTEYEHCRTNKHEKWEIKEK